MKAVLSGPTPFAIAHRGSRHLWPENTMVAFQGAHDLGFRWLETDVHVSSDGVVVCFHDDTLERTTSGDGPVWEKTFAEIESLDAGFRFARTGDQAFRSAGVTVPSLEEVLTSFPDVRMIIDLKQDGIGHAVWRLLNRLDAVERVIVGSFKDARLQQFRELSDGRVATSTGQRETFVRWLAARAGRTPAAADAIQVPVRFRGIPVVTTKTIAAYHRAGSQVHVWTVNDMASMERLLDQGVDGLITDRPDRLREVLEQRGCWTGGDGV